MLGLGGGYLTPVLLSTGENHMWTLAGYTSMLNLGALAIARVKRWPALEYLAWPATGMLFLGWADAVARRRNPARGVGLAIDQLRAVLRGECGGLTLVAAGAEHGRLFRGILRFAGPLDITAAHGRFTLALALAARRSWRKRFGSRDRRLGQLAAAMAVVLLTLAIPIQFVGFRITMLWSLEAAALAWIACALRPAAISDWERRLVFALVFVRLVTLDVRIYSIDYAYTALANRRFLTFAVAAASLWIASRFARIRGIASPFRTARDTWSCYGPWRWKSTGGPARNCRSAGCLQRRFYRNFHFDGGLRARLWWWPESRCAPPSTASWAWDCWRW